MLWLAFAITVPLSGLAVFSAPAAYASTMADVVSQGPAGSGAVVGLTNGAGGSTAGGVGSNQAYWVNQGSGASITGFSVTATAIPNTVFQSTGPLGVYTKVSGDPAYVPITPAMTVENYCTVTGGGHQISCNLPSQVIFPTDQTLAIAFPSFVAPTAPLSPTTIWVVDGATLTSSGLSVDTPTLSTISSRSTIPSGAATPAVGSNTVSGTGDAGSTVSLKDASDTIVGTATIGTDGSWLTTLPNGFGELTPTFTDINGNAVVGTPIYYNSYVFGIQSPADGSTVNPGVTFSGHGQPNSPVTIKDADGTVLGTTVAEPDGSWSVAQSGPFLPGTHNLTVLNTTSDGTSTSTPLSVNLVAPDAPLVDPSDGRTVTGTAEPGSTITIRDGGGNVLGSTVTGGDGRFTFTPVIPFGDGTTLAVTATDAAGNESPATTITVDAPAPATPPTSEVASDLAHTGSDTLLPLLGGIALITIGLCFYAWRIRRRTSNR